MRVPRLFVDVSLSCGAEIRLDQQETHYLCHVLRLGPGADLVLFNGQGGEYRAVLRAVGGEGARVSVSDFRASEMESPLRLCLAQGISRGERMDYAVQKAVELGVTEVVPLLTERCGVDLKGARAEKRISHWRKVAASACMQCGRNRLPQVLAIQSLDQWLGCAPQGLRLVLDPKATKGLAGYPCDGRAALLIGPEGGLTEREFALAARAGFERVRLGPRTLRTETAAVGALAAMQALWGDLGGDRASDPAG